MADLSTGTTIAGYRIEAVLGHGSMGTVYSALDAALERRVALKILTPELARDERFRDRFLRESKLAASLEHPHIVPIHAAGEADGQLFLAMRYIEGRDLAALLRSLGRLDLERVLAILDQVSSALDSAHARGLVHRDVKPANIMLTQHGGADYAYLCDFGLAKHTSTVSSLTGSRAIVGTVDYLAPEQIEGRPIDGRADVYALGCVLFECLTGTPPYERANELAALLAHVNDEPPPVSEQRAELPEALDQVVATALAKDRNLRYATCKELVQAARAAVQGDTPIQPQQARTTTEAVRTFLFADVRGYTAYTREHGDEAAARLAARFAELVEQLAPVHAGGLQELRGDEALVVFDSARQALRFALALQGEVAREELERPVGIGLDAGEAVPVEDGFRGTALNRAARLCALARPGEVLASDAVRELAGATDGVAFGFRRVERLKGFEKPVGVVEVHPAERTPTRDLGRRARRTLLGTRPRLRLAAALAVVVAAGAAAAAVIATTGGSDKAAAPIFGINRIALLDATTLKPVGTVDDLGAPDGIWHDPSGQIWTIDVSTGSAARIDPKTRKVVVKFPLNLDPGGPAWGAGSFWLGDFSSATVVRYDSQYGSVVKRIDLPTKGLDFPDTTNSLAFGAGSVWAAYGKYPFRIARIDPVTNRVVKTIDLPNSPGEALLAFGAGSLWAVSRDSGRLWRIDPATYGVVATAKLHGGWVEDLRIVGGYAWLPIENDSAVWKVDRNGNILKSIPTGDLPWGLGDDGRNVYVVNQKSATVSRIDPATDAVKSVHVGHRPQGGDVGGGLLWVPLAQSVADATAGLAGKKTARILTAGDPLFNTDPALTYDAPQIQLQEAIGARLLRYPDRAQPSGATLEPELSELPVLSNGGRTYSFRIGGDYRFSPPSGAPVTAEVMRYSIERALSPVITEPTANGPNMVQDIVGFKAYRDGKAEHISGIEVKGQRLSITLVEPAPDFLSRISLPFFSAVPLGTPALPHGVDKPIPSAGPYYVAAHVGNLAEVIKRNPNYTGPRPSAIDAFVVENGVGVGTGALRVGRDDADYVYANSSPYPEAVRSDSELARKYGPGSAAAKSGGQRYFVPPATAIQFFGFNPESKAFRDPSVRRAVNFAIDRRALAAVTSSQPAESVLPPGVPGSGGPALYPLDRPDLARARALMRGRRLRAVLYNGTPDNCPRCADLADILRRDLGAIGIDLEVKALDDRFGDAQKPGAAWDLIAFTWFADWADPNNFVNVLFDPGRELGYGFGSFPLFKPSVGWPERIRAANRVQGPARARAYRKVGWDLFRASPPAAVYALQSGAPQVFSSRLGCQVFRPQDWGYVDLAALCLRGKG